jgi:hypothetical protein
MNRMLRTGLRASSLILVVLFISCERPQERSRAHDVSLTELEKTYGRLIAVGNAPTRDQHGTGDRIGLFQDDSGTVWGIPLTIGENNEVFGCAPPELRELPATDKLPSDMSQIVGTTNEPGGWRGGTGRLELVFRDNKGELRWHALSSAELKTSSLCMTQSPPVTPSSFYRLVK